MIWSQPLAPPSQCRPSINVTTEACTVIQNRKRGKSNITGCFILIPISSLSMSALSVCTTSPRQISNRLSLRHSALRGTPSAASRTITTYQTHQIQLLRTNPYRYRPSLPHQSHQHLALQIRHKSKMVEASQNPLSGLWKPTHLQALYYGPNCVKDHLLDCLPSSSSKAFIVTGSSLATKTSLIKDVETLLGSRHAGTFSNIKQHAPVADLDKATELVLNDDSIDTIISIGGGSPIDSAKAISYRLNEKAGKDTSSGGKFLHHIAIPTTLSAAECTPNAGFTNSSGQKTGVAHPSCAPHAILYDATFAAQTPSTLYLSTGLRALDHAMELMYHAFAAETPTKNMALQAAGDLFTYLPLYKRNPKDENVITKLQLAAYASLGFMGLNVKGGIGLSHTLGYALGSPYGIPHGVTSCLTLGHVVKLKAGEAEAAPQIARMAPFVGVKRSGDERKDAEAVGQAILDLVERLGLKTSLGEYKVGQDQAEVITRTATRSESGELHDRVLELVKWLW